MGAIEKDLVERNETADPYGLRGVAFVAGDVLGRRIDDRAEMPTGRSGVVQPVGPAAWARESSAVRRRPDRPDIRRLSPCRPRPTMVPAKNTPPCWRDFEPIHNGTITATSLRVCSFESVERNKSSASCCKAAT